MTDYTHMRCQLSMLTAIGMLTLLLATGVAVAESIAVQEPKTARVLIFGGTGRLGSDIANALVDKGHSVTVFARATSSRERLVGLPVTFAIGDVLDLASIDMALRDKSIDVVVDALGRGSANVEFYAQSAANIATSAARNHVQQIILHGSVGAGGSVAVLKYDALPKNMQRLMDAKTQAEESVVGSGIHYTIIRNSRLVRYGTAESGNAKLYSDQTLTGSVTRQGLARLTESCVLSSECFDKIYHAVDKTFGKKKTN